MNKIKHAFNQCDKFCEENLSQQINRLSSYFHLQLIQQLENNSDEKNQQVIPDETQQLFIEYTCLPLFTLDEDPKPSGEFSIQFIQLLEKHYIDFEESPAVNELIKRIVIPLCQSKELSNEVNEDDFEENEQMKQLKSLRVFIDCYFASLVSTCQRYMLRELGSLLYLFSKNVRIWAIRAFYLTTMNDSFDLEKRKVVQNVLAKYKSDWSDDINWSSLFEPVEYLSTKQLNDSDYPKSRQDIASIGITFLINLFTMCSNELQHICINVVEETVMSDTLKKTNSLLLKCLKLLNDGDLKECIQSFSKNENTETNTKKQKRKKKLRSSFNGFDSLMTIPECQQVLEQLITISKSVNVLTQLKLHSDDFQTLLLLHRIIKKLVSTSELVVTRVQTNSTAVGTYYEFMEQFVIGTMNTIIDSIQFTVERIQIISNDKTVSTLSKIQIKIADKLFKLLTKDKLELISKVNSSESILATLLSASVTNDSPIPYIIYLSEEQFEKNIISILEQTLIWTSNTYFRLKISSQSKISNTEQLSKQLVKLLTLYILHSVQLCAVLNRYEGSDSQLNLVFQKLLTSMKILDYQTWITRRKNNSNVQETEQISIKQTDMNILLRIGITKLLQTDKFYQKLSSITRDKLKQQ
jgi:hypothetical protein